MKNNYRSKKAKRDWHIPITIIIALGIIVASIITIILLSSQEKKSDFTHLINFLYSLIATLSGAIIAILGVYITIKNSKGEKEEALRESHIPEFFIPCLYDIRDAVYIKIDLRQDNEKYNKYCIPIKNTDKTAFYLKSIVLDSNNTLPYERYVDKNSLTIISIYLPIDSNELKIILKSLSNEDFPYTIKISNENFELRKDG